MTISKGSRKEEAAARKAAYDREKFQTVAARVRSEEYDALKKLAESQGETVSRMISKYVRLQLNKETYIPAPHAIVIDSRDYEKLMSHVGQGKFKGNPDELARTIIKQYFVMDEAIHGK